MRSSKDREKLTQKGFTIVRVREDQLSIWKHTETGSWKLWQKFTTKYALEKELKRIDTEEPLIIIE